jgi:hypothetical protein
MRRSTVILWLLVVFASGTTVGVATYRYYTRDLHTQEARPSRDQIRKEYLGKLRDRVGASEDQIARIIVLLDEGRAASDARRHAYDADMKAIQDDTREKIRALLTPEQLSRYELWREERKREREKHDRERKEREKAR